MDVHSTGALKWFVSVDVCLLMGVSINEPFSRDFFHCSSV